MESWRAWIARLILAGLAAAGCLEAGEPLSARLPHWLHIGAEFRGRLEGSTGLGFVPGLDDAYYLHRIRAEVGVRAAPWLLLFAQVQNSEAPGFARPVPANVTDHFDFHQAFVDFGRGPKRGWGFRIGRQEINFGGQRLVGSGNWGNVGRSYNGVRLYRETERMRLDWFASGVVRPNQHQLDGFRHDHQLHGFHLAAAEWIPKGTLESYFFWKRSRFTLSERGAAGRLEVATAGVRALGPLPGRFDYIVEMAFQAGRSAGDPIRAWGGNWAFGYTLRQNGWQPHLQAGYAYGSGDKNPADGVRNTLDQLYPTNHSYYGQADRLGWRNMHETLSGLAFQPHPKWRMNLEYHSFWMASRADALYSEAGVAFARNPNASSPHLAQEVDVNAVWELSESFQLFFGYAHIFPGAFLRESTPGSPVTLPYVQWRYIF